MRDIKANEEITISYGTGAEDNSWEERRDWLKMKYNFGPWLAGASAAAAADAAADAVAAAGWEALGF